jgi:simple sugar transport system permease protein
VNAGILIALALALLLWLYLYKTPGGFRLRVTGLSRGAAAYAGIDARRVSIFAFVASGGVAGLMGAERVLGVYSRYIHSFSPGYGFTSIAVALLAANNPLGVIPAALLFGALENGGSAMSMMVNVPRELGMILEALIIVFIAGQSFLKKGARALFAGVGR